MSTDARAAAEVVYPESDGKPMADNTLQWDWMVKIVGELREQFAGQEVFVAGDLFWYPVEGNPKVVAAPDAMVAFGRPPGYRGSYKQWEEGGVVPQVVFEVLSPNNTALEMHRKLGFYDRHGVEEYYLIDPDANAVTGYRREDGELVHVLKTLGYTSPRLGTRFELRDGALVMIGPDGREFLTREERVQEILVELQRTAEAFEQVRERAVEEGRRADAEQQRADAEQQRADAEQQRANAEQQRADVVARHKAALVAKLRELGIDPDDILRPAG